VCIFQFALEITLILFELFERHDWVWQIFPGKSFPFDVFDHSGNSTARSRASFYICTVRTREIDLSGENSPLEMINLLLIT
jgi:hypothetical protein